MDEATRQTDIVSDAAAFAAAAHAGQVRKGGTIPYIVHPMEVAAIVARMTSDPEVIAAALLHDVVEDTDVTIGEVEGRFGRRVAEIVAAESEDKQRDVPASLSWRSRKQSTVDHIASCTDRAVLIVCLADKLSNIRSMAHDYREVGDKLWRRFHEHNPAMHAWYYRSLSSALARTLGATDAWSEFDATVRAVFGD